MIVDRHRCVLPTILNVCFPLFSLSLSFSVLTFSQSLSNTHSHSFQNIVIYLPNVYNGMKKSIYFFSFFAQKLFMPLESTTRTYTHTLRSNTDQLAELWVRCASPSARRFFSYFRFLLLFVYCYHYFGPLNYVNEALSSGQICKLELNNDYQTSSV